MIYHIIDTSITDTDCTLIWKVYVRVKNAFCSKIEKFERICKELRKSIVDVINLKDASSD